MKIAVIGAAGRTGAHVVGQALARGDGVIAIARTPEKIGLRHDRLTLTRADVRQRDQLAAAIDGADALISALGTGGSRGPTDVYSLGASNELDVMRTRGIDKLAVISAAPAGPRAEQPFLQRRLAMPLLELFLGPIYADMRRMETILGASRTHWVALRPPRLVDSPATGTYRVDTKPLTKGRTITYQDLATALLDSLTRNDLYGHAAYVAN
jgi:putative NADH-flavin reductase